MRGIGFDSIIVGAGAGGLPQVSTFQIPSIHDSATDMADAAGFRAIAEPPSLVADGIVAALAAGQFHVFPDTMARNFWSAYQGFARAVVEADAREG